MIGNSKFLKLRKGILVFSPLVLVSACLAATVLMPASATVTVKPIATGVTLTEEIDQNPPEIIHTLTIDLSNPNIHLEPIPGQDTITGPSGDIHGGREEVRETAVRHGAAAAVNGDFFPFTGDPLGAAVWNGELYSEPYPGRCVMGIEPDGHTVMFDNISFLGELQTQQNQMFAVSGVDRAVSATDPSDLVVFTPTFGPRAGIRAGCTEVVLTGVNLPLRPSKLMVGTVSAVNVSAQTGASIPAGGIVLAALPNGPAGTFLTTNIHVGDKAEFVCSIAPQPSLDNAVKLALQPRGADDLPVAAAASADPTAYAWSTVRELIGGGPHLVVDGSIAVDGTNEGFTDAFIDDPNPRTGVGVTADGKLLLITVDGRQALSRGVSLADFAAIMQRYGAVNAMNLDGGGSTTMVANGLMLNSIASTGVERPVANSLCVFAPPLSSNANPAPSPSGGAKSVPQQIYTVITGLPEKFSVGQSVHLSLLSGSTPVSGNDPNVLWQGSLDNGIAYVDQTGQITALQPGTGTITANYQGKTIQQPVTIYSGTLPNAQVLISGSCVVPDSTKPKQTVLLVGVYDGSGMPVPNTTLQIKTAHGSAADSTLVTNVDGEAQTTINWKSSTGGTVTVSADGLVPKVVSQP